MVVTTEQAKKEGTISNWIYRPLCLNVFKYAHRGSVKMNTLNITNYEPKDFAELLGVSGKIL